MVEKSQEHCQKRDAVNNRLFAFFANTVCPNKGKKFKVLAEDRSFEEVMQFALPSRVAILLRSVPIDPELFPNISTDQNANAWVNGVEFADVWVKNIDSIPENLPDELVKLIKAAWVKDQEFRNAELDPADE